MNANEFVNQKRQNITNDFLQLRINKGLSRPQLETKSGTCRSTIYKIEHNCYNPSLEVMLRLLFSLGKTIKIVDLPKENTH